MSENQPLNPWLKWMLRAICALVLVNLGMRTWEHQAVWLDEESLWQHVRKQNPGPAYRWLGRVQHEQGRDRTAALSYRLALKHEPDYSEAHLELGLVLNRLEQYDQAERHLRRAFALDPYLAEYYNAALGIALYEQGRLKEADKVLRLVEEEDWSFAEAQHILRAIQKQQAQRKEPSP